MEFGCKAKNTCPYTRVFIFFALQVLAAVVEAGDSGGDGAVDYNELVDMLGLPTLNVKLVERPDAAAGLVWGRLRQVAAERGGLGKVLALFRELDRDRSGAIGTREFAALLAKLQVVGCSPACLAAVVAAADGDSDGSVRAEIHLLLPFVFSIEDEREIVSLSYDRGSVCVFL
jgi:Ca2+-binding EF-hand superfamily protein